MIAIVVLGVLALLLLLVGWWLIDENERLRGLVEKDDGEWGLG